MRTRFRCFCQRLPWMPRAQIEGNAERAKEREDHAEKWLGPGSGRPEVDDVEAPDRSESGSREGRRRATSRHSDRRAVGRDRGARGCPVQHLAWRVPKHLHEEEIVEGRKRLWRRHGTGRYVVERMLVMRSALSTVMGSPSVAPRRSGPARTVACPIALGFLRAE